MVVLPFANMSLQELPTVVIHLIITYIPDYITLCHFEGTCRNVRAAMTHTPYDPCYALYVKRWSFPRRHSTTMVVNKQEYARRHLKDKEAKRQCEIILNNVSAETTVSDQLRKLLVLGSEVIDLCWKLHDEAKSTQERQYMYSILNQIQFTAMLEEMIDLFHVPQLPSSSSSSSSAIRMEDMTILISLLGSGTTYRNFHHFAKQMIRDPLDRMAQTILQRVQSDESNNVQIATTTTTRTPEVIFQTLNEVFFQEESFSGNLEDYYDFDNSLLHAALQKKRGIPMTLALLYKYVARRLGLDVDVVGLPGHIVVSIPSLNLHVDVFHHGRILHMEDLVEICHNYGFPFQVDFLQPLSPEDTLARVCKNMMNCIARDEDDDSNEDPKSSLRLLMVILIGMLLREPHRTNVIMEKCHMGLLRRWDQQYGTK